MPLVVAIAVVAVLIGILFVAFGRDPGPAPADVAIAYERAWDRLDFSVLYDLSGDEMRDGLGRDEFVAAKRGAHGRGGARRVSESITVASAVRADDTALVVTELATADGRVRNDVVLERRTGRWAVIGYSLRRDGSPPGAPA
ncbi:MAG TPA: hypothetical protein VFZ83_11815 [Acidimicrobiia bacterium]|nr:hypothetical protein [Acidimicrobiia bacterium]